MDSIILTDSTETANEVKEDGDIETLRKKHLVRGLSSFINLNLTCYLAASLQCLLATDALVAYIRGTGKHGKYKYYVKNMVVKKLADVEKSKGKNGKITISSKDVRKAFRETLAYDLRKLIVVAWGANCKIKPVALKKKIIKLNDLFTENAQNDAQECINFILDRFHEETKSDVVIELRNVPEQILEYNKIKNKYTELINDNDIQLEEKNNILTKYREYKTLHLKEDAGLNALEYWQKFIRKNHSAIVDLFYTRHVL
mgnify:CR=1 FL=1